MPIKVLVPRLGEGVEEITITRWLKQEGDTVRELEPLLEVNTDKVDTEIPCPASGTLLKIEMPDGQTARVGQVLALISGSETPTETEPARVHRQPSTSNRQPSAPNRQPTTTNRQPPTANRQLGFIPPVVSKIAAERGVDLQQVPGTGMGGRITKEDVLAYLERRKVPGKQETRKQVDVEKGKPAAPNLAPGTVAPDTLIPHTPIRKQIAQHMLASKQSSPPVLTVMEADLGRVAAHQAANRQAFEAQGVKLTYTAYFMAALAAGLKARPIVNSSWGEQGVLVHPAIHIGMATSLGDEGLIVPVIKNADALSLLELARAVNDLAGRARAKKLQPEEVKGGTFTLTNHGVGGSLLAMPIINQPQCGILGVGAIQKRAVVVTDAQGNDAIAIRPMAYLSFVFDHRILDGASADRFLAIVKQTLENWT